MPRLTFKTTDGELTKEYDENLTEINLSFYPYRIWERGTKQIIKIPSEISQLINLTHLDLDFNRLKQLPPEINMLINLRHLKLHHNQLITINFNKLKNLTHLDISDNLLSDISISACIKLQFLDLSDNSLKFIPYEIGDITNLHELDLSGNQIIICFIDKKIIINDYELIYNEDI